jgi:RNA polymerase sigma-70 factor, ECF subfamily
MESTVAELVERARQGEADAFTQLVRNFERMALSVAFGVLGDAAAAGDVSQDALIRAWERLNDLREPHRFGTWLCGIVRNLAVDRLRRRRRTETLGPATAPARQDRWTHDPVDDVCRRESHAIVVGAIDGLDEVARVAVKMRYYDALPSKQIARLLGISADAVDMRLIRARKRLRDALPEQASA